MPASFFVCAGRRKGPLMNVHAPADGPRPARPDELPEVLDLINTVFRTDERMPATMGREFPRLLSAANADHLYITKVDDKAVAHVGVYEQTIITGEAHLPVACVGAVCTHREYRGQGLAGALMDLAVDRAKASGNVLMLISGDRPVYLARGASRMADVSYAELPRERFSGTGFGGVRRYCEEHLDALFALQAGQSTRYVWEPASTRSFIDAHVHLGCGAWVHGSNGQVDGFLVVRHQPPQWYGGPGHGRVIQLIGVPPVGRALCAAAVAELKLAALDVDALPSDADARGLLRELDVGGSLGLTEWTVLVLDLARMLALCGLSGRRAGDVQLAADGKTLIITSGESTVRTSWPEDIHAVLFGPRASWPPGMRYLPPSVRAALADVLPIPLCSYGINYI